MDKIKDLVLASSENELPFRLADFAIEKEVDFSKDDNDINHPKWDNDRYFEEYAKMYIHYEMIKDKMRTNSYRNAVLQNPQDFKDKVVLDVGCGTGILSIFCVEAGARKVYAVDASEIADHARKIVENNGLSDKIEVIKGKMEEIVLPEKVDVIISEWMGLFLLFESMLESVILARNRWLKEDGKMYPSKARLHIAPIANDEFKDKMEFFTKPQYGINFSCLVPLVKYEFTYYCNRASQIQSEWVCSNSQVFFESDLRTVEPKDIKVVQSEFKFSNINKSYINGFGTWFDVTFEGSQSTVLLTTSPFNT
jgi:2-polyprenyl-3-methyl-5-hydroxy-6-metoxy-1,4-benzoquinol methylase